MDFNMTRDCLVYPMGCLIHASVDVGTSHWQLLIHSEIMVSTDVWAGLATHVAWQALKQFLSAIKELCLVVTQVIMSVLGFWA